MSEHIRIVEIISRDDVVQAWKRISAQGFGDPAETLDIMTGKPKTKEILHAEQIYNSWYESEKAKSRTPEEELRFQFTASMLYIEAGFTNPDYLCEVAYEWLAQDAEAAAEQGFTELASEINVKIDEIIQAAIKQIIEGAGAYIDERTRLGKGPWMEGLVQTLFQIENILPEQSDPVLFTRLEDLKVRVSAVFTAFGESTFVPNEAQKNDFLARVNIYANHYPNLLVE